jgi:shikimate kinase
MGKTVRPLLLNKTPEETQDYIRQQLTLREPFYTKARHILDVNLLDNYDKIKISVERIKEMLHLSSENKENI